MGNSVQQLKDAMIEASELMKARIEYRKSVYSEFIRCSDEEKYDFINQFFFNLSPSTPASKVLHFIQANKMINVVAHVEDWSRRTLNRLKKISESIDAIISAEDVSGRDYQETLDYFKLKTDWLLLNEVRVDEGAIEVVSKTIQQLKRNKSHYAGVLTEEDISLAYSQLSNLKDFNSVSEAEYFKECSDIFSLMTSEAHRMLESEKYKEVYDAVIEGEPKDSYRKVRMFFNLKNRSHAKYLDQLPGNYKQIKPLKDEMLSQNNALGSILKKLERKEQQNSLIVSSDLGLVHEVIELDSSLDSLKDKIEEKRKELNQKNLEKEKSESAVVHEKTNASRKKEKGKEKADEPSTAESSAINPGSTTRADLKVPSLVQELQTENLSSEHSIGPVSAASAVDEEEYKGDAHYFSRYSSKKSKNTNPEPVEIKTTEPKLPTLNRKNLDILEVIFSKHSHASISFEDLRSLAEASGAVVINGSGSRRRFSWKHYQIHTTTVIHEPHGGTHQERLSGDITKTFKRILEGLGVTPDAYVNKESLNDKSKKLN